MELLKQMEILSGLCGVSGWETPVREEICKRLEGKCDYSVDALGNVIARLKGKQQPGNTIMLSAHMDEVGFIITVIEDSGLLKFTSVGGIDTRVVVGKTVEVGDKRLPGVIGTKAVHLQEASEREKPLKFEQLYIDIGAQSKEDAMAHVLPGDRAVFAAPFGYFGDSLLHGRALDDRAGCALLLELVERGVDYDCTLAFTVQEETGCAGGATAAYTVSPDIAIVVETTTASDIAGVEPDKMVCKLGEGPVVSFMDRGAIYDTELYRLTLQTAKDKGIPCQSKAGVVGGNESKVVQTARGGARMIAVSLPCRYIHSPSNVLHTGDVAHTADLLQALVSAVGSL